MNDIIDLIVPNSFSKIRNGKLDIPDNLKYIKLDVGLCAEAGNSAAWLADTDDRFVIAIEPLPYHWTVLQDYDTAFTSCRSYPDIKHIQLEKNQVVLNRQKICLIDNRICGMQAAIDNVEGIGERDFYEVIYDDTRSGASSLLKLTPQHQQGNNIKGVIKVPTVSLKSILDLVPWDRFEYIEHVKTDCEGYDPVVVRSAGEYLSKIVFFSCEVLRKPWQHCGEPDADEFIHFMAENNFQVIKERGGEIDFINTKLAHKVSEDNLNNNTLGT
tara:strand:- start:3955 stop:4767 length:813 start_codon:yes stop_codon:yes gene_type:complete